MLSRPFEAHGDWETPPVLRIRELNTRPYRNELLMTVLSAQVAFATESDLPGTAIDAVDPGMHRMFRIDGQVQLPLGA